MNDSCLPGVCPADDFQGLKQHALPSIFLGACNDKQDPKGEERQSIEKTKGEEQRVCKGTRVQGCVHAEALPLKRHGMQVQV